jgi:Tfp pilus assembly protein PilF
MRPKLLLSLLLVAGCSGNHDNPLSTRPPGLDVADVALANGAPDTALHIAQQALAANPRDVSAMVRIAQAQTALGQRDQAAHGFRQALALEPNNTGARRLASGGSSWRAIPRPPQACCYGSANGTRITSPY